MDTNILLESGTNELEILEFLVDGNYYGINVAKIREILSYSPLTPIPNGHPFVEGAFSTRGDTVTVINLAKCLGLTEKETHDGDMFLITNFNGVSTGFCVHGVVGIHRVNWSQIIKPDRLISNSKDSVVTGIINIDSKLVLLLDFENIVAQISPEVGIQLSQISKLGQRAKNNSPIIYAEDSQLLSMMIYDGLTEAGYTNVIPLNNGMELWELLEKYREEGTLQEKVACIITDLEMPQMDGHRLLKLVKEHPVYKNIPVVIFSSLINEDMRRKGESLGADAQFSKNDMGDFVQALDQLLG
ncbi:MAG: chemotaxis protein [Eubacteriales bacterium]|nr:chemotaxis protein [Eubacteriales bacterium]